MIVLEMIELEIIEIEIIGLDMIGVEMIRLEMIGVRLKYSKRFRNLVFYLFGIFENYKLLKYTF